MDPAAPAIELLDGLALLLGFPRRFLAALFAFLRALLLGAADTRVGGAVGDEIGGQHVGHLRARRVVLAQEAGQRRWRDRLQQSARGLVAGIAGARENLGGALAGFE